MEFDAEARKSKEKNKAEELNKNKIRKNLKLPTAENEENNNANISNNITNNNTKRGAAASKNKKEINFISQKEIETKQKLEEKLPEKVEQAQKDAEADNTKNAKKSGRGRKPNTNQSKKEETKNAKADLKNEEHLATNRKLEFSDENVEKITPLLIEQTEVNTEKNNNNNNNDANLNGFENSENNNNKENEKELISFNEILTENENEVIEEKDEEKDKKIPKKKKPAAPKKPLKEIKPIFEGDFDMIVNYEDLLKKEKIENSDLILLIIEICQNASKYNLKKSNKSKLFWDEVFLKAEFAQMFKQFKPETLRKYWRVIAETNNVKAFLETTLNYAEKINNPNIKYFYN